MFTKADAEAYFVAEKQESLLFFVIGIAAIAAAFIFLLVIKTSLLKGMAVPLLAIGLLQAIVGYTVFSRSDAQRKDMVYRMDMNPGSVSSEEVPRMEKVMHRFELIRRVEIILLLAGILLIFIYRADPNRQWWLGAGVGLALQAALMLGADYVAEKRGGEYLTGLRQWAQQLR